jgi:hypothetical protein
MMMVLAFICRVGPEIYETHFGKGGIHYGF